MGSDEKPRTTARPAGEASECRVVLNPTSGTGDHADLVRWLADERGYTVAETAGEGDGVALAKNAVDDGVDAIAACGGDGTVHEVMRGIYERDAFDRVTMGVIPTGTANIFASNIGIETIEQGFEALRAGEIRRIDIGVAGDEPFAVSCIAGVTADVSEATGDELKERFGTAAFVITAFREVDSFETIRLEVDALSDGEETRWTGEALCVLVGNSRRFANRGGPANMEDGLLEVTIVERMPSMELIEEAAEQRLLGHDTDHVTRLTASRLGITINDTDAITFSLDGETCMYERLGLSVRQRALRMHVGSGYVPSPPDDSSTFLPW